MTALSRALNWFIAPPPADAENRTTAPPPNALGSPQPAAWQPPSSASESPPRGAAVLGPPVAGSPGGAAAFPPSAVDVPSFAAAPAGLVTDGCVTSAAVLGRAGDVEPVAAALALALRRQSGAKAATVAVVGPAPPVEAGGGSAAARRIVARLDAHGFEAHVRGRLAWVRLDPSGQEFAAAARRVTLIAAPAVLAVTAPRTSALDDLLAELDLLVIVSADPRGPLAHLASSGLPPVHVVAVRPLSRGPRRALARAGVCAPRRLAREVAR